MGTINVFEASRMSGMVRAIVNVTSDKCYENKEQSLGYKESDPVGGYDPYSTSKGCSELITGCWRNSFFNLKDYGNTHNILLASGRAGNVIGGGDWATDRLIPDIIRAVKKNEKVKIRNPQAIRPWQHVLEPLSGYLLLGQKLLEGRKEFAQAWNFGPSDDGNAMVGEIVRQVKQAWSKVDYEIIKDSDGPHEAGMLKLDCSKSRTKMQWMPVWDGKTAVEKTVQWYKAFYESNKVQSLKDLQSYIADAKSKNVLWA
jgi:CDP-glucose 4,6-dehydratase